MYAVPQLTLVDGQVRFDINKDPDDVRVDINPNENTPPILRQKNHENTGCLRGISDMLMEESYARYMRFKYSQTHSH